SIKLAKIGLEMCCSSLQIEALKSSPYKLASFLNMLIHSSELKKYSFPSIFSCIVLFSLKVLPHNAQVCLSSGFSVFRISFNYLLNLTKLFKSLMKYCKIFLYLCKKLN